MKEFSSRTISSPIHTRLGTITSIDWAMNSGTVDLVGIGEVPCSFSYGSQSWIFNRDSYILENIDSHSAFAFCQSDKVLVVVTRNQDDPSLFEYITVAVLTDNFSSVLKRPVWPVYRLGYDAMVLNATYVYPHNYYGFPFIQPGSRDYINPYTDHKGVTRALGTGGGSNNALVITEEGSDFIPHAMHEFMEPDKTFAVVPDILLQNTPNFKGRIIGFSDMDEILIDNIPVLKINHPENIYLDGINISFKESTVKLVHVNEVSDILTILFITVDYDYHFYPEDTHPFISSSGYMCPPYAFSVYKYEADLSSLCIYDAMLVGRENIPLVNLVQDLSSSWVWYNRDGIEGVSGVAVPYGRGKITEFVNLSNLIQVGYFGKDIEISLKVSTTGLQTNTHHQIITYKVITNVDGTYSVSRFVDPTVIPNVPENSFVVIGEPSILWDTTEQVVSSSIHGSCTDTIRSIAGSSFNVTHVTDNDYYYSFDIDVNYNSVAIHDDTIAMSMTYNHSGYGGDFEIAKMFANVRRIYNKFQAPTIGDPIPPVISDSFTASYTMVIFTYVDPFNALYGFWEVTFFNNTDMASLYSRTSNATITWKHYFKNASSKILTRTRTFVLPNAIDQTEEEDQNIDAVLALVPYGTASSGGQVIFQPVKFPIYDRGFINWYSTAGWLHDIRHPQNIGPSGYITNSFSKYPLFSAHPFGSSPTWLKLPYLVNVGNPQRQQSQPQAEETVFPTSIIYSKTTNNKVGSAFKRGQYSYVVATEGGTAVLVKSQHADRILTCTGKNDMALTTQSNLEY